MDFIPNKTKRKKKTVLMMGKVCALSAKSQLGVIPISYLHKKYEATTGGGVDQGEKSSAVSERRWEERPKAT